MSSSAISTQVAQLKIGNVQNQADTSAVYNGGIWSFKNSTALTSVTIDNSGNVGIGATSVSSKLDVQKDSAATNPSSDQIFPAWTSGAVLKNASATDGAYSGLSFLTSNLAGTTQGFSIVGQSTNSGFSSNLLFMARTASGTTTERMRIDSSGRVGISTGSPTGAQLEIFNNATAGHLRISTLDQGASDSSRADIDFHVNVRDHTVARLGSYYSSSASGGSGGLRVFTRSNGSLRSVASFNDSGSLTVGASTPVSISPDRLVFGTGQYYVLNGSSTGVRLDSGATSWVAQSDERSKKNIKPLELGLEQIKALKPSRFDYKTDESEQSARVGFIAQEVLPVLPHAVFGEENSEQMLGVSATEMIPVLVKAIQELSNKIDFQDREIRRLKGEVVEEPVAPAPVVEPTPAPVVAQFQPAPETTSQPDTTSQPEPEPEVQPIAEPESP